MSYFDGMSVDDLQSYYSDFHKDYFGYRPRSSTPEQWVNRDWLIEQINGIHNAMDEMKKTYGGREQLRAEGWHLDEKDFV
jgi:pyridoxine/pyridoxamine 5'-phosphate oxidase